MEKILRGIIKKIEIFFCNHKTYKNYHWGEIDVRECKNCDLIDYENFHNGRIDFF